MKKLTALIALLVFPVLCIFSQNDKKAREILDKLSAKTKSYSSIKAEFSYSLVNKDRKINTVQNWKLLLNGDKYRLDMGDQLIISDGKSLWKVLKNDKEVELSNAADAGDGLNPKNIFTMYEKGFRYKYIKEEKAGNRTVHLIDLFPENPKEKDYISIRLYIDKTLMQIYKSELKGKNGNVYTYLIKSFTTNESLDASKFTYKPAEFPGFELNDVR
jgi:outer membrane lipoprotein carrier protein